LRKLLPNNSVQAESEFWNLSCIRVSSENSFFDLGFLYWQVKGILYLASTVKSDNSIEEEIQYRITLGNKAYLANKFFFQSTLFSKKSKLKLYWGIMRPIVT
jgi:hypothetical protein